MPTSVTISQPGSYIINGTVRAFLSGTGPVGSQVWVTAKLYYGSSLLPNSEVLVSVITLNSANNGQQFQASAPIAYPLLQGGGQGVLSVVLSTGAAGGASIVSHGILDDDNGRTSLHYVLVNTPMG